MVGKVTNHMKRDMIAARKAGVMIIDIARDFGLHVNTIYYHTSEASGKKMRAYDRKKARLKYAKFKEAKKLDPTLSWGRKSEWIR